GDAVMPNKQFKEINLNEYKGKYLILLFYPLDFTFVCPTELIAFSERFDEFKALNSDILGISVDSKFTHLAFLNTPRSVGGLGEINFPLLSDITREISIDYKVLLDKDGIALRGVYIIDPEQKVRVVHINDLPIGRSVDEILRLLEALTYHASFGEVCPANWKKGELGMKDTQKGKDDYFRKLFGNSEKTEL
ncbi:thioredoxin peroxidase Tpx1, partial [Lobulomyces angularis]